MEQNKQGTQKKSNTGLKVALVGLSVVLLGSAAYIYKIIEDNRQVVQTITDEKGKLEEEIKQRIAELDALASENTALKEDIEAQKAELTKLLEQLSKSRNDAASLRKFKDQYLGLKREVDSLVVENKRLKDLNVALTSSLDSTNVELGEAKKFSTELSKQNDNLSKTVEIGSKLAILNVNVLAVKEKKSGKEIDTDKASKANKLKVSFLIAENSIAETGERAFYIQIIDPKKNVVGEKKIVKFGDNQLTYSFEKRIKFENKTVKVEQDIKGDNFESGSYTVNVYSKEGKVVADSKFSLR